MGWFEEQLKARKELDAKTFEDSFLSLAGIRTEKEKDLSDEAVRENYAISQILSYFRLSAVDIPSTITSFNDKLHYALDQYNIDFRKVELNASYVGDGSSPILIFTFLNNFPVVLFPKGNDKYYYVNYKTGKRVAINATLVHKIELDAYVFNHPLPNSKISISEYGKYLRRSIQPLDLILLVLFSALSAGVGLLLPYLTRMLTGTVVQGEDVNQWMMISIYVAAAATGLLLINAVKGFVTTRISLKIEKSATAATMEHVLALPPAFFKRFNTGELITRFRAVPALATTIVTGVFVTFVSAIMSLSYLFQMVSFAPVLILPVVLVLLVSTGFSIWVAIVQRQYQRRQYALLSKESGVAYEMINGIQKIRLSGSEKRVFAKWASAYSKTARVRYRPPMLIRLSGAISLLITLLGSVAFYYLSIRGKVDVGSYMAFVTSYGVLSAAFASLVEMVGVAFSIGPTYEMARPILEATPESQVGKTTLTKIKGNIKLEDVSFQYGEGLPLVVDHMNLDIKEGEYVAIVGQTGCGKTTLVRLLLGFEKPTSGKICFDDHNIEDVDISSLRRNIGTVLQTGVLFHADIYSNIIISNPSLSEEEAWKAAEIANIADDIRAMPMKMKTVISEGQGGISGGQKQRLMIARAIVHKPKVLIFDEATSALDNKTQRNISESVAKLNCTRIVIAHRLSTIKSADRILMLEGGKIIEEGTYQSLIEKGGKFAELVERQRLDN